MTRPVAVSVRYPVRPRMEAWVLPEEKVSEAVTHDMAADRLTQVLRAWGPRSKRDVFIARNFAIRFIEAAPQIGIDPDVCVLEPPPPHVEDLGSLRLWVPGHVAPPLCIEIVSENHPHKDYVEIQDRYAAIGTRELVVFDPLLAGPVGLGGPVALQLWRRDAVGLFERVHFGSEPVFSTVLGAWFIPQGRLLGIADDRDGSRPWLSFKEAELVAKAECERERAEKERERAEKERERAEKERERAARLDLEARVRELEAKMR